MDLTESWCDPCHHWTEDSSHDNLHVIIVEYVSRGRGVDSLKFEHFSCHSDVQLQCPGRTLLI
jgi:hypothetical protein